ncbi:MULTISPECIES: YhfC family glutamic-type intramembrane protease [Bacillota]|jgi:uncharacterized membrane protein YhfC|uniref:YhfC family intramembrane metalloprotease n=2 Tax=Amedibacillus TaxID=2749846 RepID=A0A7G9GQW1_9FIRM|nr:MULTISPECIES: YhfC family glutamic-type intramembrane protease [Bacillota]QNM13193.1 YhfC family intramembrane metalloprotease [[Eubacterium] hominis]MCH4287163.1 YhfC family intramembrane metalloprotease [Amedibacillus hominis]RGB49829.1 YhfC family intramembrane metalloprotease [Absiella sp. AM22-9]RGB64081.1 YhfC family intramembrane metalloprotease [Absiella sp. AM09-45]RGB72982.1 YhfC family intramembrane metalloprotease [Absiella sp. AM09-50]
MKTAIVILVCFLMPILLTICLSRKQKGLWVSFVVGMLAFVISQMVLRLPLLSIMTQQRSISLFTLKHPVLYILILAFTAGLFEETARLIGFQCIKKKHASIYDAFAFGLGHGGIEAMLLIGIPLLSVSTDLSSVLLACGERILAIAFHVAMSIIVWYGVKEHKNYYIGLAIVLHMLLDCYAILGNQTWVIEGYILILTVIVWIVLYQTIIKRVRYENI